ncbi:MAG: OFA family MFS transporter [Clostridiales bacterium]|nr:OFA family MFS transporter [Clostridiales bacterium]
MEGKGNRRWVVLLAGMLIQLCAGIIYMWSVFKGPVATYLGWDAAGASLTSSIMLACFVIGIIVGGRSQDVLGPRKVVLAGSLLMSVGMLLTALVRPGAPWLVYLTYGVISGLGTGAVYTTAVSAIQKWYPDRRGFATGMMVAAFGFSLVVFAPLATSLLGSRGVPFTFTAIGLIFLAVCGLASMLVDNPPAARGGGAAAAQKKQYATSEMLRTPQFYLIALSMMLVLSAYFILNPMMKSLGAERGLTDELSTLAVMLTGIASASGRLLFSWLSDLVGRKGAIALLIGVTLVAVLCMIGAQGIWYIVCLAAIAFAFGGSAGVYPALTADLYGTRHMGLNYGCVMAGFGISALLFPVLSGRLAAGGVYTASFVMCAAACAAALALVALIKPIPEK